MLPVWTRGSIMGITILTVVGIWPSVMKLPLDWPLPPRLPRLLPLPLLWLLGVWGLRCNGLDCEDDDSLLPSVPANGIGLAPNWAAKPSGTIDGTGNDGRPVPAIGVVSIGGRTLVISATQRQHCFCNHLHLWNTFCVFCFSDLDPAFPNDFKVWTRENYIPESFYVLQVSLSTLLSLYLELIIYSFFFLR